MGPWGTRPSSNIEISVAREIGTQSPSMAETQASCGQCGAVLAFKPGSETVQCTYCGSANEIAVPPVEIIEHDLNKGLEDAALESIEEETQAIDCASCQAVFSFDINQHAGECPFCGHSIVTDSGPHKHLKPAAVLPFVWPQDKARQAVQSWLGGLWFAPNRLKEMARTGGKLHGMYLPYWTFDSQVAAQYKGQRGEFYLEPQRVSTTVNGRRRTETRMVQKVRWQPARGAVRRYFNDVLILASDSLPEWMSSRLGPWNLGALKPYTPLFLQGFQAQSYNVSIERGFGKAEQIMRSRIQADIRVSIGGDLQQIQSVELSHSDMQFKHILLPLWLGVYRYQGRNYHLSVNGQSGEVQGERPYSIIKVAAAALSVAAILALVAWLVAITPK